MSPPDDTFCGKQRILMLACINKTVDPPHASELAVGCGPQTAVYSEGLPMSKAANTRAVLLQNAKTTNDCLRRQCVAVLPNSLLGNQGSVCRKHL